GLGWALKVNKSEVPFLGRDAVLKQQQQGIKKKLAGFTVSNPDIILLGRETIFRNGERVGWLSSGGYGHHIGCSIGYGYIRNAAGVDDDYILGGEYQLEVATRKVNCSVHLKSLYDPAMKKIKC
ncbi:MAG: hypothetical protein KTR32_21270, partial [Granulosicoccus sp.]|nr:hypothetical protein [Granulosicoccus sp.]